MEKLKWLEWEIEQLEKYDGEVFVEINMDPIPWHASSRRYNIYNSSYENEAIDEIDLVVDCEMVEEDGVLKVIEL